MDKYKKLLDKIDSTKIFIEEKFDALIEQIRNLIKLIDDEKND